MSYPEYQKVLEARRGKKGKAATKAEKALKGLAEIQLTTDGEEHFRCLSLLFHCLSVPLRVVSLPFSCLPLLFPAFQMSFVVVLLPFRCISLLYSVPFSAFPMLFQLRYEPDRPGRDQQIGRQGSGDAGLRGGELGG